MPKSGHVCYTRQRKCPAPRQLRLGSDIIPHLTQYRYLGVIFDQRLTFRPQAGQVLSRASHAGFRVASILTQAGPLPLTVRQLVQAIVLPIISYGFPVWKPPSRFGPSWNLPSAYPFDALLDCLAVHKSWLF